MAINNAGNGSGQYSNGGGLLGEAQTRKTVTLFIARGEGDFLEPGQTLTFDENRPRHSRPRSYNWDFPTDRSTLTRKPPTRGQVREGTAITQIWGTGHVSVSLYPLDCGRDFPTFSENGAEGFPNGLQNGSSAKERP